MQSKHIVIFDTLIKQSKSEEVEAVLGTVYLPLEALMLNSPI